MSPIREYRRADGEVVLRIEGTVVHEWPDGDGPEGRVRQFVSFDDGVVFTAGLWFEGDGYRLRPMLCRREPGCTKVAGHSGPC